MGGGGFDDPEVPTIFPQFSLSRLSIRLIRSCGAFPELYVPPRILCKPIELSTFLRLNAHHKLKAVKKYSEAVSRTSPHNHLFLNAILLDSLISSQKDPSLFPESRVRPWVVDDVEDSQVRGFEILPDDRPSSRSLLDIDEPLLTLT